MKSHFSILIILLPALFCLSSACLALEKEKPNVVLILIDDLGWMDLGCQGNKLIETKNIDALAAGGMRFTSAYAAAPVCSPTRAAILTGMAPARLQLTTHIPDRPDFARPAARLPSAATLDHLPTQQVTIAERLKEAGYATAFLGKWHLAGKAIRRQQGLGRREFYPENQGFDLNIGGCAYGGPPTYFDPYKIHNLPSRRAGEYLPVRLADEAIQFIRNHKDKPFFLSLWNYTVHWPMEAPQELIKKYSTKQGPGIKDPRYAAMIQAMDLAVGRLMAELETLNLSRKTLVIFTSDNGGYLGVADMRPLRLGKGYLYEGGIRVPLIVRWPGKIPCHSVSDVPVISTDFFPTILQAVGLEKRPEEALDGRSLIPVLTAQGNIPKRALYFHYPNYAWHGRNRLGSAVRQDNYKLIENFDDGSLELYDLKYDLGEKTNLAAKLPEVAGRLQKQLHQWRTETQAAMPVGAITMAVE